MADLAELGARTFQIKVTGQEGGIPQIGLGTAGLKGEVCRNAVCTALKNGYRYIDTALLYGNQEEVKQGIRDSQVARKDFFVVSKVAFFPPDSDEAVWMFNSNNVKGGEDASIDLCLEQLDLDTIDLMLVHNPCTSVQEYKAASCPHFFELFNLQKHEDALPATLPGGDLLRPIVMAHQMESARKQVNPNAARAVRESTWQALERAQLAGKVKMIGVSNYPAELLVEMKDYATVMPAVNQLELHPRFASPKLQEVAQEIGCVLTGYGNMHAATLENNKVIAGIAARVGRTPYQVVLRWLTQHGISAIPRSHSGEHQEENLRSLEIHLSVEDMQAIDALHENYPYYWHPPASVQTMQCSE